MHDEIKRPSFEELELVRSGGKPEAIASLFGTNFKYEESAICVLGVPWDLTASYHRGACQTPFDLVPVSHQLDLEDPWLGRGYELGIYYRNLSDLYFPSAERLDIDAVNQLSVDINERVYQESLPILASGRKLGILGGDHSVPFGAIKALAKSHGPFSILHLDAHHDLRRAYEGFEYSHASIFYNVMEQIPEVTKLVSVGIRDFSIEEVEYAREQGGRIETFYDADIKRNLLSGRTVELELSRVLDALPPGPLYFSVDIDGLDPSLCPGTGTPVPGGLNFDAFSLLCQMILASGRPVIGFDLSEVCQAAGDREWNLNVGARVLYKLCTLLAKT